MHNIESRVLDAAYELGAVERIGGVRRGAVFQGIAEAVARATGAEGVGVTGFLKSTLGPASAVGLVGPWTDCENAAFEAQTRWAPRDRPIASRLDTRPAPKFWRTYEILPPEEFHRTKLYNEFQRPRGIGDQISMCLRAPDGGRLFVAVARVGTTAPLSGDTVEIAQRLAPIIERCWLGAHRQLPTWVRELTPRRRRVLELVAEGMDDHQIARIMGVRYNTVRAHLKDLFQAAGVRSRLHLIQSLDPSRIPASPLAHRIDAADSPENYADSITVGADD